MSAVLTVFFAIRSEEQNDSLALYIVANDLAQLGWCVDRLKEFEVRHDGQFWKYTIPVRQVIR